MTAARPMTDHAFGVLLLFVHATPERPRELRSCGACTWFLERNGFIAFRAPSHEQGTGGFYLTAKGRAEVAGRPVVGDAA